MVHYLGTQYRSSPRRRLDRLGCFAVAAVAAVEAATEGRTERKYVRVSE